MPDAVHTAAAIVALLALLAMGCLIAGSEWEDME